MAKQRIAIDAKVMHQMFEYAAFAKHIYGSEIAGYGHYRETDGIYKLAPLTKQIVTGGDVDAFPSAIINDVKYDISDMIVQWHSHVEMDTFFSGTDQKNIKDMLKLYPMLISIVVNVKGEYRARLDIRQVSYGKHKFILPESDIVTFDLELIPYYTNNEVYNEVKAKLRRPKPPKPPKPKVMQLPVAQQQSSAKADGQAELFESNETGLWWEDEWWSTVLDETENGSSVSEAITWTEEIILLLMALVRDFPNDFRYHRIPQTGSVFITHDKSHTFALIEEQGVTVQGNKSSWREFLLKCGSKDIDYVTRYTYSTDNIKRVRREVNELLKKADTSIK